MEKILFWILGIILGILLGIFISINSLKITKIEKEGVKIESSNIEINILGQKINYYFED